MVKVDAAGTATFAKLKFCLINAKLKKILLFYMFQKNELKILFPFYAHSLLFNLSKVIMPFYVLYFLDIGLTFFQIALISGIRSIVSLIFEIPTGVIADKYSRKFSVILGYILTAISLALIPIWDSFVVIAIIFAFDSLFETLVSGADRAWAVDLIENRDKSLLDKYFLRTRLFRNIGMVIAPLAASYVVAVSSMRNLWFIFAGGIILSTIILSFAEEIKIARNKAASVKSQINEVTRDCWQTVKYALSHSILILLFMGIFIFYFVDEISSLAWTPYIEKNGFSLPLIGYLFSIIAALGIILPLLAQWLLKKKSKLFILFSSAIGYATLLIIAGKISSALLIAFIFILFSSIDEIFLPLEEALTNQFINSQQRASVLSLKSITESLASIIGAPIAGVILGFISEAQALILSGFLILALPFVYLTARNKLKNQRIKTGQA